MTLYVGLHFLSSSHSETSSPPVGLPIGLSTRHPHFFSAIVAGAGIRSESGAEVKNAWRYSPLWRVDYLGTGITSTLVSLNGIMCLSRSKLLKRKRVFGRRRSVWFLVLCRRLQLMYDSSDLYFEIENKDLFY